MLNDLETLSDSNVLYVAPRLPQTRHALESLFEQNELAAAEPYRGVLAIHFHPARFEKLSDPLAAVLSREELQDTKCCVGRLGAEPSQAELMQTESLQSFFAWVRGQWLTGMVRDRRLTTFFQPIVECRDPSKVFAHECLLRGRRTDGQFVSPDRLYSTARDVDQLDLLDQAAKITHIESAARFSLSTQIFINFNLGATHNFDACLAKTLAAIHASGIPAERFVFEVTESDKIEDSDRLKQVLASYRQMGFRVALDDLGSGYASLNSLTQIKPDFIKLDMQLIRAVHRDPYKSCVAAKLLEMARDLKVATVVEGVEERAEWQWAADHGADFAQGYLFARPAAMPPQPQFFPGT
ncbi:MAG TPA: EAL domain-containing protein [Pirellulales bacterium]|jgi:EAL domain-containing protein (putative c-di-GMP-specific phosphodiesterase class I)|nr:EAL domain-containing protein [Pirellulales bacterium]